VRAIAVAALALTLSGCGLTNLFFPTQSLQLINQSTTTVVVRVAPYTPGQAAITSAKATYEKTLDPREDATFQLPTGHYGIYAEATTTQAEDAVYDVTLKADKATSVVLNEKLEDRPGSDKTGAGYRVRQLGWTVQ
jgi:hypothetical protein